MMKFIPRWVKDYGRKILKNKKILSHEERYYCKYNKDTVLKSIWVGHYLIYKKMIEFAEKIPTIDLCCGSGAGTKLLSESLRNKAIGIDYSNEAIAYAQANNQNSLTTFKKLDLNDFKDLQKLKKIIFSQKFEQVFFIEGIEHIHNPKKIISTLIESGVKLIFISTPFEKEDQESEGFHISPFTPSTYKEFSKQFNSKLVCYAKAMEATKIHEQIRIGVTESELLKKYFADKKNLALNYLILIDNRN